MIKAKFKCERVRRDGENEEVHLMAAYDDQNKAWSKWTPAGSLTLTINNPDAQGKFEEGKFYFLDLSPAPAKQVDE